MAQTVAGYLGYSCQDICRQDVAKMGQSGHTGLGTVAT